MECMKMEDSKDESVASTLNLDDEALDVFVVS